MIQTFALRCSCSGQRHSLSTPPLSLSLSLSLSPSLSLFISPLLSLCCPLSHCHPFFLSIPLSLSTSLSPIGPSLSACGSPHRSVYLVPWHACDLGGNLSPHPLRAPSCSPHTDGVFSPCPSYLLPHALVPPAHARATYFSREGLKVEFIFY